MRHDEKTRISHALGQAEELLGELAFVLVLGPDQVKHPKSPQHRKELWRLPEPSALDLPRFRRRLRAWVEPPLLILFFMSMKSILVY